MNWGKVCMELEDYLAPVLGMKPAERAMYAHLLRHSRLEGRRGVLLSLSELARGVGMREAAARLHLFALGRKGCVVPRHYRRKYAIEVRLPEEAMRELRPRTWGRLVRRPLRASKNQEIGQAILKRERGRCFYCRKTMGPGEVWFDHVVPLACGGWPSEDNVVACCEACNRRKGTRSAGAFLRELLREKRLTREQYRKQLAALKKITQGKHRLVQAA